MAVKTELEKPAEPPEPQGIGLQMSFLDHLEELRRRIIKVLVAIGLIFAACFSFADELFRIAAVPVKTSLPPGDDLIFTRLTEPFNVSLKIAFVAAVFFAAPFILAQVWLFIAPGLYQRERRYAVPFVLSASVLFVLGGVFGYFVAFPYATAFLIDWGKQAGLQPLLTAKEYFDLELTILLGLGIIFQIPPVIFVLSRIGLVDARFLLKNTKYATLIAFVIAAIITPTTDIPNMMLMAGPMILLYLVGILVALVFGRKRQIGDD